jgi:hypothetical protein
VTDLAALKRLLAEGTPGLADLTALVTAADEYRAHSDGDVETPDEDAYQEAWRIWQERAGALVSTDFTLSWDEEEVAYLVSLFAPFVAAVNALPKLIAVAEAAVAEAADNYRYNGASVARLWLALDALSEPEAGE